jgi:PLP dependent protein
MSIAENVKRVKQRIASAAERAGRRPEEIVLMAVSKTHPPELIRQAYEAGVRLFGENRVQEFAGKTEAVLDLLGAEWHLIGHLQTNKAVKAAELFSAVDSVDSLKLAEKLNAAAGSLGRKLSILLEVNVGGEEAKSGVVPDGEEQAAILEAAPRLDHLAIRGLMTVPPYMEDPQQARPFFRRLRELQDRIVAQKLPGVEMSVLSMGMSHDFEVATEEGSTSVRLGTAIFGERTFK